MGGDAVRYKWGGDTREELGGGGKQSGPVRWLVVVTKMGDVAGDTWETWEREAWRNGCVAKGRGALTDQTAVKMMSASDT